MGELPYGQEFRRARREQLLTQVAVARALEVSQSYVAQIEAGRNYPSPALASRIAELLGVNPPSDVKGQFSLGAIAAHFAEPSTTAAPRLERVRLPIVGVPVPGDEERMMIDARPHGSVLAPPQLENVPGAQALYVRGRSMEPRYYPGELVYINPTSPLILAISFWRWSVSRNLARQSAMCGSILVKTPAMSGWRHLSPKRDYAVDRKALVSIVKIVGSGLL